MSTTSSSLVAAGVSGHVFIVAESWLLGWSSSSRMAVNVGQVIIIVADSRGNERVVDVTGMVLMAIVEADGDAL